ncbi:unnamed protein product [Polarella glacialis]|uniref:Uncharacterized protein n=1 Tax=Polarella glacialis TaxID=89957 RepID=A0A813FVY5_POLGL|nr:unnamed protein product [Polarella glacialis]
MIIVVVVVPTPEQANTASVPSGAVIVCYTTRGWRVAFYRWQLLFSTCISLTAIGATCKRRTAATFHCQYTPVTGVLVARVCSEPNPWLSCRSCRHRLVNALMASNNENNNVVAFQPGQAAQGQVVQAQIVQPAPSAMVGQPVVVSGGQAMQAPGGYMLPPVPVPYGAPPGGYWATEKYCGIITILIALCICPFVCCCPCDERDVYVDPGGRRWQGNRYQCPPSAPVYHQPQPAVAASNGIQVQVPDGVMPGQQFQFQHPQTGQTVMVTAPAGGAKIISVSC